MLLFVNRDVLVICVFDIDDIIFVGFIDILGYVFWFVVFEVMYFMYNK